MISGVLSFLVSLLGSLAGMVAAGFVGGAASALSECPTPSHDRLRSRSEREVIKWRQGRGV